MAVRGRFTVDGANIAEVTAEKEAGPSACWRGRFGLGFVIGPLLGGFLEGVNISHSFFVAGGLTLRQRHLRGLIIPEMLNPEAAAASVPHPRAHPSRIRPLPSLTAGP